MTKDQQEQLSSACFVVRQTVKERKQAWDEKLAACDKLSDVERRLEVAQAAVERLVRDLCQPITI